MNEQCQNQDLCYHQLKQPLVGVCPFCLTDKLLAVASKQRRRNNHQEEEKEGVPRPSHSRKLSNVGFALGSLLNRLHQLHNRRGTFDFDQDGGSDTQSTSTSLEDSFISIKFEENGVGLWDNTKVSKAEQEQAHNIHHKGLHKEGNGDWERHGNMSVTSRGSMRWRKRIGHLFQLIRWKRSCKSNGAASSHVSGIVKVRNRPGWIRTLTGRRTYKE